MRRPLIALIVALLALPLVVSAREKRFGYCQTQSLGTRVKTCTVEVFITGTLSHPTQIYQDNIGTPLGNPFTASSSTGLWFFYADNARYDVKFSGGTPTITPAYTLSDYLFLDMGGLQNISALAFQSASANIAQSGTVQLAASDTVCWRNVANSADDCLSQDGSNRLTFSSSFIGMFTTASANPAQSGIFRLASGDSIGWRNNANTGDNILNKDAADALRLDHFPNVFSNRFTSASANPPALGGFMRLATDDKINWRNTANSADISLSKTAADQIDLSQFTALRLPVAAITPTTNPALSGILQLASTDTICWRNATNVSDQCLSKNSADVLVWPNAISINGDTVSGAARAAFTAFLPGNLTSTWTAGTWVLSKPINATSIRVQVKTAPVGCSPNAVIRIGDGVTNWDTTITAAANGGPSGQSWGLTTLTVSVLTAAAGCGTSPADANLIMEYRTN